MSRPHSDARLLAQALYEASLLLRDLLGSNAPGQRSHRVAAHLLYALHNEAEALAGGGAFDIGVALAKVAHIDAIIGGTDGSQLAARFRQASDDA